LRLPISTVNGNPSTNVIEILEKQKKILLKELMLRLSQKLVEVLCVALTTHGAK
jgi:hypothetical protein